LKLSRLGVALSVEGSNALHPTPLPEGPLGHSPAAAFPPGVQEAALQLVQLPVFAHGGPADVWRATPRALRMPWLAAALQAPMLRAVRIPHSTSNQPARARIEALNRRSDAVDARLQALARGHARGGELPAPVMDLTPVWEAFLAHVQGGGLPPELLERPGAALLAPAGPGLHELLSELDGRVVRALRALAEGGDAPEPLGKMLRIADGVTAALLHAG